MALKAYVLIEAQAGSANAVVAEVAGLPEVKSVDSVTGPYDAIANVEVNELDTLGEVVGRINCITGIIKTMTCVKMNFPAFASRAKQPEG
jgi:DNA-binding Lrp family transcriptional regulator